MTHLNAGRDDCLLNTWGVFEMLTQLMSELDPPGRLIAVPTPVGSQGQPGRCVWSTWNVRCQSP